METIREHERVIDPIDAQASFEEIEAAARVHKLRTVEALRSQWQQRELAATGSGAF